MSGFGGLKRLEGAWGTWVGLEDLRGLRSLRGHEGLGLHLVEMLMFGWDFKVNAYLRFWNCNTYVQDLWTVNCDLVIWTQPSGPLCLWQCFIFGWTWWLKVPPIWQEDHRKGLIKADSFPWSILATEPGGTNFGDHWVKNAFRNIEATSRQKVSRSGSVSPVSPPRWRCQGARGSIWGQKILYL